MLRLEAYRTGGGQAGNVARGQVRVLKTSIPYVSRVENRSPAIGGAEAETLADAKARGPLLLRSRGRAVTEEDFEELARDVAPDAARVRCVPEEGATSGVRVLVVPHVASDDVGRIERADLDPPWQILERISNSLDERRLVGTRLLVQPPDYLWLTAVVSLSSRPRFDPGEVRTEVLRALYRLYHPLYGGPDGTGWPFGRSVQSHEVHAALARIPGVDMSREVRVALFPAEADTGRRGGRRRADGSARHRTGLLLRPPGPGDPMRGTGGAELASSAPAVRDAAVDAAGGSVRPQPVRELRRRPGAGAADAGHVRQLSRSRHARRRT